MSEQLSIPRLSARQRAALETLRAARGLESSASRIPRRAGAGAVPLSFAQQRLWYLQQLEPDNAQYNVPAAIRLSGTIDIRVLARCFREIVQRHESLRTTFASLDDAPVQIVAPPAAQPLPVVDLAALEAAQAQAAARRLARAEARRPFDLARDRPLRTVVIRLDASSCLLCVTMHHIVSDGWSRQIFMREMATLYRAFAAGRPSPLAPLPVQYADFAEWQRGWLQGSALEAQREYWRRALAGEPAALELPLDHPRAAVPRARGAQQTRRVDPALAQQLREYGRSRGLTLFMTTLSGWLAWLYRCCGQRDLVVGTAITGRTEAALEGLIGFFVNTLVLRVGLSGQDTFEAVTESVRQVALGAYAHQDLPFEKLVEEICPERTLSHSPLFQVMFTAEVEDGPRAASTGGASQPISDTVRMETAPVDEVAGKFDLAMSVRDTGREMTLLVDYKTDLFDAGTIARSLGQYHAILAHAMADPRVRVAELRLLTDAEQRHIVQDWNASAIGFHAGSSVTERIAARVRQDPEALALLFEDTRVTYGALERDVTRLARRLRARGVRRESPVVTCIDAPILHVVTLLAVLEAGGVHVPLDPTLPAARQEAILRDLASPFLVTERALLTVAPPVPAARIVVLEDQEDAPGEEAVGDAGSVNVKTTGETRDLRVSGEPSAAAYIVFTSGSTGTPNGVTITHAALAHHCEDWAARCGLAPGERVGQSCAPTFDVYYEELLPSLAAGATVVLRGPALMDAAALGAHVRRHRISVLNLSAGYWQTVARVWAESPGLAPVGLLRLMIVGSDRVTVEGVADWRRSPLARVPLMNAYGPTEATITATAHEVADDEERDEWRRVPIGRPLKGRPAYILDRDGGIVPPGVAGELRIGGPALARGLLGRPGLTAARFLPDPFGEPGGRLYRTGDRARYRTDGAIDFLGRIDHQIKIRGFRVELGEVEAVLGSHPAIEAVVVAADSSGAATRLVAWYVARAGTMPTAGGLLAHAKERLPRYMVPAAFVRLDALPMTATGKVDRQALPAPLAEAHDADDDEPRTAAERTLMAIWQQVLRRPHVSRSDNFFALGGDSILSLQVTAKASQAGLHLTPRDMFEHQTVAELAAAAGLTAPVDAEQGPVSGLVPLTPVQSWFFGRETMRPSHFNQAIGLETDRAIRPAGLARAVARLLTHHDALRLRYAWDGHAWRQSHAAVSTDAPFTAVDAVELPAARRRAMVERLVAMAQRSLDLTKGPVVRFIAVDHGPSEAGRLFVIAHHLVVDGVSWRVLLDDLRQLQADPHGALPAKTTSFKAWAERLVEHARTEAVIAELPYWLALCRPPRAVLPRDVEGANTVASARTVMRVLDAERTDRLLRETPGRLDAEIDEILLAAVAQTCARWAAAPAIVVDLESHGRDVVTSGVDVSRTVGWFTVVRPVALAVDADLLQTVRLARGAVRGAPHRGRHFGLLAYASRAEGAETLRQLPDADISFNYLGQLDGALGDGGPFRPAGERLGPARDPGERRFHLFDIGARVVNGRLHVGWTYSAQAHRAPTVEALAGAFITQLETLIDRARMAPAPAIAPEDFPLAGLDDAELTQLRAALDAAEDQERGA